MCFDLKPYTESELSTRLNLTLAIADPAMDEYFTTLDESIVQMIAASQDSLSAPQRQVGQVNHMWKKWNGCSARTSRYRHSQTMPLTEGKERVVVHDVPVERIVRLRKLLPGEGKLSPCLCLQTQSRIRKQRRLVAGGTRTEVSRGTLMPKRHRSPGPSREPQSQRIQRATQARC